jgi:hypothetical protein
MIKKGGLALWLSALFLVIFFPTLTQAQKTSGLSISPPSFEFTTNKGEVLENSIRLENLTNRPLQLMVYPQNFTAYGQGGQVELTDEETNFAIAKWITFNTKEVTIAPKGDYLFTFQINIPSGAEPGSHYGAIVFRSKAGQTDETGSRLAQEIGSLILLKIPGNLYESANLISFAPETKWFKADKAKLIALVENNGNVHVKPYGSITIKNILNQKIYTHEVLGRNVLPGSKRLFDEEFEFKKIGFYKAEINLIYAGGGKMLKGETQFVNLNQTKFAYLAGGLSILLVIYLLLRKRINRALKVIITGK